MAVCILVYSLPLSLAVSVEPPSEPPSGLREFVSWDNDRELFNNFNGSTKDHSVARIRTAVIFTAVIFTAVYFIHTAVILQASNNTVLFVVPA